MKMKVRKFKEKLGVVFPDEVVAPLGWEPGDVLEVEVENNGLKIVRVETALTEPCELPKRPWTNIARRCKRSPNHDGRSGAPVTRGIVATSVT